MVAGFECRGYYNRAYGRKGKGKVMKDVFDRTAEVEELGRGAPLTFGDYLLAVDSLVFKQGHKGDSFKLTLRVLESKPVGDYKPMEPGSQATQVYNVSNPGSGKYAASDMKHFVACLLNKAFGDVDGKTLRELVSPDNAEQVAGLQVRARVTPSDKLNPKTGEPYSNLRWANA